MTEAHTAVEHLNSPADLQRLRHGVLVLLRVKLRNKTLAEDLCNEAFRIVLERLREQPLEDPDRVASYLAQTARYLARTHKREVMRQKTDTGEQKAIEETGDPEADPSKAFQTDALGRAVRQLLKEIPNIRDREILVRTYLRDEDRDEICRELGIDETHYRRVISRARARFRELLERRYRASDLYVLALA